MVKGEASKVSAVKVESTVTSPTPCPTFAPCREDLRGHPALGLGSQMGSLLLRSIRKQLGEHPTGLNVIF